MPKYLILWLGTGIILDILFLSVWTMIYTGMAGELVRADFRSAAFRSPARFAGKPARIVTTCILGLAIPPYVLGGIAYLSYWVRRERARLRGYGWL